jgi:hypothetical protein
VARPATGTIKWRDGAEGRHWYVQVTLVDGSRSKWISLDPSIPYGGPGTEAFRAAKAGARLTSDLAREHRMVRNGGKKRGPKAGAKLEEHRIAWERFVASAMPTDGNGRPRAGRSHCAGDGTACRAGRGCRCVATIGRALCDCCTLRRRLRAAERSAAGELRPMKPLAERRRLATNARTKARALGLCTRCHVWLGEDADGHLTCTECRGRPKSGDDPADVVPF